VDTGGAVVVGGAVVAGGAVVVGGAVAAGRAVVVWWSSGGSLVLTPDCEPVVYDSNLAIFPVYSGLPIHR
jgi:hypothetical protein